MKTRTFIYAPNGDILIKWNDQLYQPDGVINIRSELYKKWVIVDEFLPDRENNANAFDGTRLLIRRIWLKK